MIKSALAAVVAVPLASAAALAGPYANVEHNAGFWGSDYQGSVTELHVGYEGPVGESAGYYIQAGPAIVSPEGEDSTTEMSGKVGVGVDLSEKLNLYGEVAFITVDGSDDNSYGTKLGLKYNF